MFTVAPRGNTKFAICFGTPRFFSMHSIFTGNVAALELVVKAIICASFIPLKNFIGFSFPKILTETE